MNKIFSESDRADATHGPSKFTDRVIKFVPEPLNTPKISFGILKKCVSIFWPFGTEHA